MERSRKFNIEELTRAQIVIAYVIAALCFVLFILIGSAVGPTKVFEQECKRWFQNPPDRINLENLNEDVVEETVGEVTAEDFFIHGKPLQHKITNLSPWNQDFFFYMNVYRRPKIQNARIGYEIHPLELKIHVLKDTAEQQTTHIPENTKTYERSLVCPYDQLNSTVCPAFSPMVSTDCAIPASSITRCGKCARITLAHETFIGNQTNYLITVQVANDEEERQRLWKFLTKEDIQIVETMFVFPAESFTEFELYFRYMFFFVSVVTTISFYIANRMYQPWKAYALEQKWTLILLVSLVLFNNPFFLCSIIFNSWFWPFLNMVFTNSFIIIYMLCILLFTDNLLKRHRRLSTQWFYLPKLILIGSLWLAGIISFWVTRTKQADDIAQNDLENMAESGLPIFKAFAGTILGVYVLWLLYLIVMLLLQWMGDTKHYLPNRVKFLYMITLLMLAAMFAGYFTLVLRQDEQMKAVNFFAFFALYNIFVHLLALMYYPTGPNIGSHLQLTAGSGKARGSAAGPEPEVDDNLIFDDDDDL